jgi:hypothetical protein
MVIEHIIAGYSIPHNEGAIPLTKEAYDINNPQKRSSDFSKTITIPEDTLTNQIFEHAFDANVSFQSFDPNKKTSYQIFQDGILLMDGYCQLRDIKNVDGKIVYNIQAIGKAGNVFESIKDLYLTDLDFSAYDHVWDYANVVASWSPTIGQGYVYPMIDLGGRTNYKEWKTTDFKPAFFVREYFTKIFSDQGYTINSAFFDTTLFKSLIVPYVSDSIPVDNSTIKAKSFSVGRSSPLTLSGFISTLVFNDDTLPYYNNTGNDYNTTTGEFTISSNEQYSWQSLLNFDLTYTEVASNNTTDYNSIRVASSFNAHLTWRLEDVSTFQIVDSGTLDITQEVKSVNLGSSTTILDITKSFATNIFSATVGQVYRLRIQTPTYKDSYRQSQSGNWSINVKTGSQSQVNLKSINFKEHDTLIMNSVVPKKIKQTDFISSIIKRFNLYLDYDSIDENLIYIEPRQDYLLDTSDDLTTMVDRSKDVDIKPLGALDANTYLFTDKEDKDKLNAEHQDSFGSVYGERKIEVDNDFVKNEKVITSIFSPTPLQTIDGQNDRVLSSVQFQDDNGNKTSGEGKIRLLYWGGTLPTSEFWFFRFTTGVGVGANTFTFYPYAGHLDNPYAPTFDLNWGVPSRLYYDFNYGASNIVTYPNSNCYNIFWRNYIQEITDKDSRLLECYVALRPLDYANLSFRYKYYIDGSFWRLLKVVDYDANANQTTKCIFLKAEPQAAFTSQTPEILGGDDVFDNGEDYPTFRDLSRPNDSYGSPQDSIIYGDNVKASQRSIIVSNNVLSGAGLSNVTALASDGSTITASDVTLINSPDTVASRTSTYINGLFVEQRTSIELPTSIIENMTGELEILPALESDEFYEITRGYARLNGLAASSGVEINIVTSDTSASQMTIPAAFFNTDNNAVYLEQVTAATTALVFGSAIKLTSLSNMSFPSGTTTLSIQLVYRIIKI